MDLATTAQDLVLATRLRRHGILIPQRVITVSRSTGLALADACSVIVQETGGGKNVYGHDPVRNPIKSPSTGLLYVTPNNYRAYKHYRQIGLGMQGVGVMQLTWYTFQDEADALGGCWLVVPQLHVAFRHLVSLIKHYGEWGGLRAYNGTGPAATAYANTCLARAHYFRSVISGTALTAMSAPALSDHDDTLDEQFPPLNLDGTPLPAGAVRGH